MNKKNPKTYQEEPVLRFGLLFFSIDGIMKTYFQVIESEFLLF